MVQRLCDSYSLKCLLSGPSQKLDDLCATQFPAVIPGVVNPGKDDLIIQSAS